MTNTEKTYFIMDLHDITNYWEDNLQGVKQYIIDYWIDNDTDDEEFETEEEWNDFVETVQAGNPEQLDGNLQGIGYTLFNSEKDLNEYREEFGA